MAYMIKIYSAEEIYDAWQRLKGGVDDISVTDSAHSTTLKKVKWEEEVTETLVKVEERVVFQGGSEVKVEHCPYHKDRSTTAWDMDMHHHETFVDEEGDLILNHVRDVAYTEILSEWEVEREKTIEWTAWVDRVPPGTEETGDTKEVFDKSDLSKQ